MSKALQKLSETVAEAIKLIDRLQAENKKLREGLKSIAVKAGTSECDGDYTIACFVIGEIEHLADAALRAWASQVIGEIEHLADAALRGEDKE